MPRTPIEAVSQDAPLSTAVGSAVRVLTLGGATLTTGLIAGVFCAYAVSVTLGLGVQPGASYVATMQAINERIENPVFFAYESTSPTTFSTLPWLSARSYLTTLAVRSPTPWRR
jgi:uncharacterized membrane protein